MIKRFFSQTKSSVNNRNYHKAKKIQFENRGIVFAQHKTENLHSLVLPTATYSPWLDDQMFQAVYTKVQSHTLVDIFRLYELFCLTTQLANNYGDFLEVGVWRGGSGALLAAVAKTQGKEIFLADTFKGVVKSTHDDSYYSDGEHSDTQASIVLKLISELDLDNVTVLEGVFPEQTSNLLHSKKLAFVHIDVDVYQSAKDVWMHVQPYLTRNSIIVFDDYGFITCSGITKLVNELRSEQGFLFIHNLNGHAIFVKND